MADRVVTTDLIARDRQSPAYASAGNSAERAGKKVKGFSEVLKGPLKTGALAGVAGLAVLGKAAIDAASDAEQSIGATETVFGKFADKVVASSKRAADGVGLSANEYRENANLIGSLFKNQGVSADKLADATDRQIKLGADLAATYGGTTKDAVESLGAAYKGEFDPLEKFGISLKQSTIDAYLAAHGQSKLTGAARTAAVSAATQAIIMKQAGSAIGAFGRETDTTAHQQQVLKARYADLSAELGTKLLPVMNKVLSIGTRVVSWLQKNPSVAYAAAAAVGVLAAGILALNLAMLANPVGLVIAGLAALAAVFVLCWRKSETFRAVMTFTFKAVAGTILTNISVIIRIFEKVFDVLGHLPGAAGRAFRSAASAARTARGEVDRLRGSIAGIHSKSVKLTVTTYFYQRGKEPGTYGNGLGVIAPGRAAGGPVVAGQPYVVGERRPELFIPDVPGRIIPDISIGHGPEIGRAISHAGGGIGGAISHAAPRRRDRLPVGGGTGAGGYGGGDTYITVKVYVTQPLGTPGLIGDAIVNAFEHRPVGSRKIPASAIADR